jgi:hypothetical protein
LLVYFTLTLFSFILSKTLETNASDDKDKLDKIPPDPTDIIMMDETPVKPPVSSSVKRRNNNSNNNNNNTNDDDDDFDDDDADDLQKSPLPNSPSSYDNHPLLSPPRSDEVPAAVSENAESIDWEDTHIDVIFDLSSGLPGVGVHAQSGVGGGSQTMMGVGEDRGRGENHHHGNV